MEQKETLEIKIDPSKPIRPQVEEAVRNKELELEKRNRKPTDAQLREVLGGDVPSATLEELRELFKKEQRNPAQDAMDKYREMEERRPKKRPSLPTQPLVPGNPYPYDDYPWRPSVRPDYDPYNPRPFWWRFR